MVLNRIIRNTLLCISFTAFTMIMSCDDDFIFTDCNECQASEPTEAMLTIKLSQNGSSGTITIRVYEGDLEDNILFATYETYETSKTVYVDINKKYTVTASYYYYGTYYIAVDSATPTVKYDKSSCEEPCYYIYDTTLNLRVRRP